MTKQKIKRVRKKRMRSYRKVMQFLWAFGFAGLALGIVLIGWFGIQRRWNFVLLGLVYALSAIILLGIRNILQNLDTGRKRRHSVYSGPKQ